MKIDSIDLRDNHVLVEMTHIGKTPDNIDINLYGGEGPVPHFHFYDKQTGRQGCIRIDKAEYFSHGTKIDKLTRKEVLNLYNWLKSDKTVFKKFGATISVFDYICILWDDNNPDYKLSDDISIPDYTQLN